VVPGSSRLILAALLFISVFAAISPSQPAQAAASDVRTIRRFDTSEMAMALTFDAGSDRGYASQILDTLRDKGVRATFGMTGKWAEANPDLILRMVNEGHQLINHSWNHPSFPSLTSSQRADELRRTEEIVRSIAGVAMKPYFRPPFGEYNDSVLADLTANGYTYNIMWTTDTLGWAGRSVAEINAKVFAEAVAGGDVLMHVGSQAQDGPALPAMIDGLRARGYHLQRVSDFIEPPERFFPETGFTVSDNFLRYWNAFGGLPTFGYPISAPFERDGKTMQYFERVRMELHPGAWASRYDVLLGRLGAELTIGRMNEAPFRPTGGNPNPNCTHYAPTGHWLCHGFRAYWQSHGGLDIFGYPISEEFTENGYTVQYFERARFEYHPENHAPWDILGGHLGRVTMERE